MFRLVLLSCLVCGIALGEEAATISTVESPSNSADFVPVPTITEARGAHAATDNKYFLSHLKLNWHQALQLCLQIGKRLTAIKDRDEYHKLVQLLTNTNRGDLNPNYWTSGADLGEKDKYVWLSTGKAVTYTEWAAGEPNHHVQRATGEMDHCIELRADKLYAMNDQRCSIPNYVICEDVA